jgi:sugar phosphate permease
MLLLLEENPQNQTPTPQPNQQPSATRHSVWTNIGHTLANPALWVIAISLLLLDACRYGFTDWGVTHLKEVQGASIGSAAFKYAVLPCGGIAGAYLSGLATDRFFGGRRAPVIFLLLLTLGFLAVAYNTVVHWGLVPSTLALFAIGFCIFGPQVLLVGTLPVDLARPGTAAAAVGFVNFMGYMGAAAGDKLTGHLAQNRGWSFAVLFWAACAFGGAAVILALWNAGSKKQPVLCPATAPAKSAFQVSGDNVS